MHGEVEKNRLFSTLWLFKALAIFKGQSSALDFATSGGQILLVVAEIAEQQVNFEHEHRSFSFPCGLAKAL